LLFCFRFCCGGRFGDESCCAHRLLAALRALGIALSTGNDVDDDAAVVFAASWAGAVILAKGAAFTFDETGCGESMMAPALAYFGAVYPHSYYHMSAL